mgnify:CR=1 FL=1
MKRYRVVETRSVFMHRYLVEEDVDVHEGDLLRMINDGEIEEIMQEHLGESIHDVSLMTEEQFLALDNGYFSQFSANRQLDIISRLALRADKNE